MTSDEFRKNAHAAVDWVADYLENIEQHPVKSQVKPGDIKKQLPEKAPDSSEAFADLMQDLNDIILPGITHWQHPHFHAYFPANSSYPSLIAEILTAGIGAQCMVWETSPAAAELEEQMMEWLKDLMSLPNAWHGVIHDTASTATLTAILTAREQVSKYVINKQGFDGQKLRVYCSAETHSSIEKGAKIAGIGSENVVKIATDEALAMRPDALLAAIEKDLANGLIPCCVVAALGTTGTLAFDPLSAVGQICQKHNVWLHVDAAYAGSAMILPELDWLREGLTFADSYVFNPHKWLLTNFDCSVYFVRDKEALIRTFEILPEYLKTSTRGQVNDYRDWGIQLGRRFRALKLWFVMRTYGKEGLRNILRQHLEFTEQIRQKLERSQHFEILAPPKLNVLVFRYIASSKNPKTVDQTNQQIIEKINASGEAFLSHTRVNGAFAIRLVLGQTHLSERHVEKVWSLLTAHIPE
ncbi:pyridoxal phosphate-dependent decarboxylase family protein [Marinoscillum furvescens]|uniref:Aromatic-L-amino-acid decarboxylase n=1 Tax=Marinoscillum furvescens DSM 4134 TaxID=1122208 RepID=A0A3D9KXK1_MARFU|nr:aminotransferase class I/II-fold pyridoxal phosphate-dependent enzyme [Marinoscillum furvescens]RED93367.1 aromatic-L-amino-acid decarboxylase [Marinoscillum furvescens DSM 4134]